jgi:hypothetical protein
VFRFSSDQREGRGFYRVVLIPRLISPTESNYYRYSPIESIFKSTPPSPGRDGRAHGPLARLRDRGSGASGESELKRRGGHDRCEVSRVQRNTVKSDLRYGILS